MLSGKTVTLFILLTSLYISRNNCANSEDQLLSRKKRWLVFPFNAKFIATFTATVYMYVPVTKWQTLMEIDIPFDLPTDTRLFPLPHSKHRRHVNNQLEGVITTFGYNGTACMTRVMCEVQNLMHLQGKSLMVDILIAIILGPILPKTETISDETFDVKTCYDMKLGEKCPLTLVDNFLKGNFLS